MQNFGENVCSILYDINLFKKYGQYKKKLGNKTIYFSILRQNTKVCAQPPNLNEIVTKYSATYKILSRLLSVVIRDNRAFRLVV